MYNDSFSSVNSLRNWVDLHVFPAIFIQETMFVTSSLLPRENEVLSKLILTEANSFPQRNTKSKSKSGTTP